MPDTITTLDECESATRRVRDTADMPEGSPEAAEMAGLVAAILEWDKLHDDVTTWKD